MRFLLNVALLVLLFGTTSTAAEFKLSRRIGKPIADRDTALGGRVLFASWIDDDHVVFTTDAGGITAVHVASGKGCNRTSALAVERAVPGVG